ncbi:MAG: hypothetical protein IKB09_06955 [Oscillospiraceae bacterium]|nr:hypothetical protein [Oscillospiraceae bacterium]
MAYPGRQNIYEATIRRMVREALTQQEQEFRQQHETDTDAQLLAYLRAWAIRKHHTPWPGEIVGGSFIQERFGSWDRALAMARLPMPKTANRSQSFVRVQEETQKQKEIYRQRKAEKKALAQERLAQQAAKKKE